MCSNVHVSSVERPCLGCRELVHRNLSKLTSAILRDLDDWVAETRVKTSQLLYELLIHAEEYTTQHMQPLTQALVKACSDDQQIVVTYVSIVLISCTVIASTFPTLF